MGGLAVVCFVIVQFVPWGGQENSAFGASAKREASTWRYEESGSAFGASGSEAANWYSDEIDDFDLDAQAVDQVRTAIPLLLGGLLVAGVGVLVTLASRSGAGPIVLTAGAVLLIAGTFFFAMGVDSLFDSDQDWDVGFILAIVGSGLALIGGVLTLVAPVQAARRR